MDHYDALVQLLGCLLQDRLGSDADLSGLVDQAIQEGRAIARTMIEIG
jgi:hypothetical protein